MSCRSSAVGNVLANFEKTISANNAAGVTSGMYLNTILAKPQAKEATRHQNKVTEKEDSSRSQHKSILRSKCSVTCNGKSRGTRKSVDGFNKEQDQHDGSISTENTSVTSEDSDSSSRWEDSLSAPLKAVEKKSKETARRGRSVGPRKGSRDSIKRNEDFPAESKLVGASTRKDKVERSSTRTVAEVSLSTSSKKSSRPHTALSFDEHTNIAPVKDVKKVFDNQNQGGGECDLMRVSRSERRRSSCPAAKRSNLSLNHPKQNDLPLLCVDKDVSDASECSFSESLKSTEEVAARSFKLAPSHKDRGASRRRVRKPVAAVVENQVPEPQEENVAEHVKEPAADEKEVEQPQQQEEELPPVVRRIKLRAASKNRKSIGRKRRTKHTIDVRNALNNTNVNDDDDAGSGSGSSGSGESDEEERQ